MLMTVFCLDDLQAHLGGRWTFRHEVGRARVEDTRFPEAAVAYRRDRLVAWCDEVGLEQVAVRPGAQSLLVARRPAGAPS